jgi:type VI protein secretion system component VasK
MSYRTNQYMARSRALLTSTDREYIPRDADIDENTRYQAISRVRDRKDAFERDVELLAEHHPELLEEFREIICEDGETDE